MLLLAVLSDRLLLSLSEPGNSILRKRLRAIACEFSRDARNARSPGLDDSIFFFCFFGNFPCMPMHICNAIFTMRPSRAFPLPRSTSPTPTLFLLPATVPHRRGRRRRWRRLRFLQVKEGISGGLKRGFWVAVAATRWWRQVRRQREKSVGWRWLRHGGRGTCSEATSSTSHTSSGMDGFIE